MSNLARIPSISPHWRAFSSKPAALKGVRNPRNLEQLGIGYKPDGFHLEKPGKNFWHSLRVDVSQKYVSASVVHYQNGVVVEASTSEWALRKQLPKTKDLSAHVNLAKVLAQRCLQFGILEVSCNIEATGANLKGFLETLEKEGVALTEQTQWKPYQNWKFPSVKA